MVRYCWRCAAPLPSPAPVTCPHCDQAHYANPKPAADAIVVRGGELLLVRRAHDPWAGCWDIPGGFIEPGEPPERAAERELWEETGIRGRAGRLLGAWPDVYGAPESDGVQERTLNLVYLVELVDDSAAAAAAGETTELRWFPLDALPGELAFPQHALPALAAARQYLLPAS